MMTHQCCPVCCLRLSAAAGEQQCPCCSGPLSVFAADQLVGYRLWAPADVPAELPVAVSQVVAPPRSP